MWIHTCTVYFDIYINTNTCTYFYVYDKASYPYNYVCIYLYIQCTPSHITRTYAFSDGSHMPLRCLSDASPLQLYLTPSPTTVSLISFSPQTFLSHPSSHSFVCKSFTLRPPTYNNSTSSLTLPRYPQPFQCLFSDHISIYIHYCIHQYMRLINIYI